ncbi:MAG: hypothetical protein CVT83_03050 [Alphaproteobacteria bacterium HGW-Alphaproteobacteria-5]|jgi:hypothetical protein|nr:MAG: hypothetical protein CVT83_03050 [Alphaproteobacteria bacterium HGW-Alphaproteobacteria-5]
MASYADPASPPPDALQGWRRFVEQVGERINTLPMLAALVLLYGWLTYYIFVDVIGTNIGFIRAGFQYYPPVAYSRALSIVVTLIPLLWIRRNFHQLSDIIVFQIYIFVFVPSAIYLTMAVPASFERQLGIHATLLAAQALLETRRILPTLSFARLPLNERAYVAILYLGALTVVVAMYFLGEYSLDSLDLTSVYERRAETISEQSGDILPYIANAAVTSLAPICIIYGILRRHWLLSLLGLAIAVESFAATSFRSHLFVPLFAVGVALLIEVFGRRSFGWVLVSVGIALTVLPLAFDYLTGSGGLYSWIVHFRFIGNNGFLTAQYFEFFEHAAKGLYQDSFGRFFFDPQYHLPIAELVGSTFSIEGNHANGNFWADGYGNMGLAGVAFASLSLVAICWLLDSMVDRSILPISIAPVISFGFGVANTAVHSVMTSNGGVLLIFLLLLMPSDQQSRRN